MAKMLPTQMKIVRGEKRPCRINKFEPKPEAIHSPQPPAVLGASGKEEWERIVPILENMRVLTEADLTALSAYCQAYERWVEAEAWLKQNGLLHETKQGNVIQSPMLGIANRAMELMHKFLTEFGMTPSSRSKVSIKDSAPKSGFAQLG